MPQYWAPTGLHGSWSLTSLNLHIHVCICVHVLPVGSDDGEDERTGIVEGGWREEKADSKTQLNKDMENESGK